MQRFKDFLAARIKPEGGHSGLRNLNGRLNTFC
jgi:hypothetical protein